MKNTGGKTALYDCVVLIIHNLFSSFLVIIFISSRELLSEIKNQSVKNVFFIILKLLDTVKVFLAHQF